LVSYSSKDGEARTLYHTLISVEELQENFMESDWVICDCRFDIHRPLFGHVAYREGHIPQAVYVDLDRKLSSKPDGTNGRHPLPSPVELVQLIESLGIRNRSQVVVYDDEGGGYAARLWWILRYLGHDKVAVLNGGIQAWIAAGYKLSTREPRREKTHFDADLQENRLITADQLLKRLEDRTFLLLDTRAPERYRGEEEPIDPVAGHIPGAVNRHWGENLDEGGTFKSIDVLEDELGILLKGRSAEDAVVYCGSGVTACHNLLAFVHAGFPLPRLYAGSWSEWSSDTNRRIETGP
jgi:thiosulfate/3-mercaptopyruvate sulfurtransferase